MKLLGTYKNGNYTVAIFDDGTKIRKNDMNYLETDFPESIDVKICNRCDMGCGMCHEQSRPQGGFGDLGNPIFDTLHPYTELAIGGGNPLEHPDLVEFLQKMKSKNVICNLTVNLKHFLDNVEVLRSWSGRGLIHGLGISVGRCVNKHEAELIKFFPNSVVHVIAGIVTNDVLQSLADNNLRLLILGYKKIGYGIGYYNVAGKRVEYLKHMLGAALPYWKQHFKLISFDNLALEQLDVKSWLSKDSWDLGYMGEDGQFTMYLDLCKHEYAVASTMERHPIPADIKTIDELFRLVKKEAIQ